MLSRKAIDLIIRFVVFQFGWFAAVLGGAHDHAIAGSIVVAIIIAVHIWRADLPSQETLLIVFTAAIGTLWDSTLVVFHVIQYTHGNFLSNVAPVWIIAVWALFATAFNTSLTFFKYRYVFASLFGAIGAPLSFIAGMKLGALQFPDYNRAIMVIAIGWAVMMPVLMKLAQRYNGYKWL
ncbi:MAG: DUF2878 domain-containing protein [Steroidobacter sp.]